MTDVIETRIAKELIYANEDTRNMSRRAIEYVENIAIPAHRDFYQTLKHLTKQAYKQLDVESPAEKLLPENTKAILTSLKEGEKYTLFFMNDWGFPCSQKIRFHSYDVEAYAQYNTSAVIYFKCKGGRTIKGKRIFGDQELYIFMGWVDVKDDMFVETVSEEPKLKVEKARACFDPQYIKDGLASVNQKPAVVNLKRSNIEGVLYENL